MRFQTTVRTRKSMSTWSWTWTVPGGARLERYLTTLARVLAAPLVCGSLGGVCSPLSLSRCAVTAPLLRSRFSRRCGALREPPSRLFPRHSVRSGSSWRCSRHSLLFPKSPDNLALVLDVLIELATQLILLCFVLGGSSSK